MSNRGIMRGRFFTGALVLGAAIISWFTVILMSPHGAEATGSTHEVRTTVVIYLRNAAIGNLILCALAGWLLFPRRRPRQQIRDVALLVVLTVIVLTSIYQLMWLRSVSF